MQSSTEQLVNQSREGSARALEELIRSIQDRVYGLALRMLYHPMDAEDATQEILVKVVTNLQSYRFEGSFQAWVYRIAANHLKKYQIRRKEGRGLDFEKAQERLDRAQARGWFSQPLAAPEPLLELEMRSTCTQALLLALDRPHRLAFILGAVMELPAAEGAFILDITPAAFRKRLSRSRRRIMEFLGQNCEFFDDANRCRCAAMAAGYASRGWINPDQPVYSTGDQPDKANTTLKGYMRELDDLGKVAAMFKAFSADKSPSDFAAKLKRLVRGGEYRILDDIPFN